MVELKGRAALVTGAGRGIGRAIALGLAREGAAVAVCARTSGQIESVAAEIQSAGGRAVPVELDVTKPESVARAFAAARAGVGEIDVLVNNAGVARSALVWKTDDALWEEMLGVNLSGTFYCMREELPSMIERKWGRVINIASVAGKVGSGYVSAYTASKHGVVGLTRAAAHDVATRGVTINAVCPGYVDTPMTDHSVDTIVSKTNMDAGDARRRLEALSPQNRILEPEEIAYVVLTLCADAARGINGQAINVDGGGVTS